jgi:3-hydroxyisobutyrate dehydrogenase-like beta-hydroxyacid dehydrogenase
MTTKIALFGAGGKMGYRLASNLKRSSFEVRHVERRPAGQELLKTGLGLQCVPAHEALDAPKSSSLRFRIPLSARSLHRSNGN